MTERHKGKPQKFEEKNNEKGFKANSDELRYQLKINLGRKTKRQNDKKPERHKDKNTKRQCTGPRRLPDEFQ